MTFIDRERELGFLQGKWQEKGAQLIVLWGKRRVGKTELVKQFLLDKPHVYFLAESTSDREQLFRFSQALGRFFDEPLLLTRGFAGWEESFEYVRARNRRFVLAIDEFPYLMGSNPAITGLFQKAWDEYWRNSQVYLVLLGSSMAMMENEVLGYRSPLYGRRTGQWRVDPMTFDAVRRFRPGKTFEDAMSHYSVGGGIPAYWLQFSTDKDFARNLTDHVLSKGAMLYDEVEFLLREELREPRYYFALLQSLAQGRRKLSEMVNATGLGQAAANKYLSVLADLKIVERELPVTEDKPLKSKKGLYRISDPFFHFWFRYVFPRRGELEMGHAAKVLEGIQKTLSQHISTVYEQVAAQTLWCHMDIFFPFTDVGRWWDRHEEIDLVALDRESGSILFGEVKWSTKPVGTDIYEALRRKAAGVPWGGKQRHERFCLFSRSGFTEAMKQRAREDGVVLFHEDTPPG